MAQCIERGLQTKGLLVRFPVRAHAWVTGQVPSRWRGRGDHTLMFLSLSFSLPSPLKINLKKKKSYSFALQLGTSSLTGLLAFGHSVPLSLLQEWVGALLGPGDASPTWMGTRSQRWGVSRGCVPPWAPACGTPFQCSTAHGSGPLHGD